jgi:hypothetical protein
MNIEIMELHGKIAKRACELGLLKRNQTLDLLIDLEAAQIAFNLNCKGLLETDDFNFIHDVCGIRANINRQKTCLYVVPQRAVFENCFLPRFAQAEGSK